MTEDAHPHALPEGYALHWYRILKVLGQGGFGITYLADDVNLNQRVAIKEFLASGLATRTSDSSVQPLTASHREQFRWGLERFVAEGQTLAKFDHPSIVRVYSVFEANNTAYMVMRYEDGEPLSIRLEREKLMDEVTLADLLFRIIDGLQQVHAAGFIHRDIKPANIFLRTDGSPVLLDFGSARQALGQQTQTLTTIISPGYAPIEQYYSDADPQGPWTDIYALGATLYRAVTGVSPMPAVDRSKTILKGAGDFLVSAREIAGELYSEPFLRAIEHALAFREEERPQSLAAWRSEFPDYPELALPAVAASAPAAPATAGDAATVRQTPPAMQTAATEVLPAEAATRLAPAAAEAAAPPAGAEPAPVWRRRWIGIAAGAGVVLALTLLLLAHRPAPVERDAATGDAAGARGDAVQAEVSRLLEAARADIAALRLTSPAGNNAVEKFQAVLETDPGNAVAKRGLSEVVDRYVALADQAMDRRRLERAADYLARGAGVDPFHPALEPARARLRALQEGQSAPAAGSEPREFARTLREARAAYRKKDYARVRELLEPLARDGNADAQFRLGVMALQGQGTAVSARSAYGYFQAAARQGNANAQHNLGMMLENGIGVSRDPEAAAKWYALAAAQGHAGARERLQALQ